MSRPRTAPCSGLEWGSGCPMVGGRRARGPPFPPRGAFIMGVPALGGSSQPPGYAAVAVFFGRKAPHAKRTTPPAARTQILPLVPRQHDRRPPWPADVPTG